MERLVHAAVRNKKSFHVFLFIFLSLMTLIPAGMVWADAPTDYSAEQQEDGGQKPDWLGMKAVEKQLVREDFEIHPRYRQEYLLDSNILLSDVSRETDSIFREIPGVEVVVPFDDHFVRADYQAEFEEFAKNSKENTANQYLQTEAGFNFTDAYLHYKDDISHTSSRSGTTLTERIPRFENHLDVTAGYKMNRVTAEVGYDDFYRSFDTTPQKQFNYSAHKFYSRLLTDLTAKTKMFVEYALTGYTYRKNSSRDGLGNAFFGGVRTKLLPKTSFYSKFGFERIGHDETTDANNFAAEVGVLYEPTSKISVDLGWERGVEEAIFSTTSFFVQDRLFSAVRYAFTPKIAGRASMAYNHQDYEESATVGAFAGDRNDDLLTWDAKLSYKFNKWMSADIMYQYNRRDSNISTFDYTDHVMTLGVSTQI